MPVIKNAMDISKPFFFLVNEYKSILLILLIMGIFSAGVKFFVRYKQYGKVGIFPALFALQWYVINPLCILLGGAIHFNFHDYSLERKVDCEHFSEGSALGLLAGVSFFAIYFFVVAIKNYRLKNDYRERYAQFFASTVLTGFAVYVGWFLGFIDLTPMILIVGLLITPAWLLFKSLFLIIITMGPEEKKEETSPYS